MFCTSRVLAKTKRLGTGMMEYTEYTEYTVYTVYTAYDQARHWQKATGGSWMVPLCIGAGAFAARPWWPAGGLWAWSESTGRVAGMGVLYRVFI
jgi:hypothetical protein